MILDEFDDQRSLRNCQPPVNLKCLSFLYFLLLYTFRLTRSCGLIRYNGSVWLWAGFQAGVIVKSVSIAGYVFACFLLFSGVAHSAAGWPAVRKDLIAAGLQSDSAALGAAAAGWLFGSLCMFVFAAVFWQVTRQIAKQRAFPGIAAIPLAIGVAYFIFGVGGCVLRHISLHFVVFAITGILFVIWSGLVFRLISKTKNRFES